MNKNSKSDNLGKKYKIVIEHGLSGGLKEDLALNYQIDELDIEDVFTDTQLSKVEQRPSYLYVSLQLPVFDKELRVFKIKEIHSFVSPDFFIVIDKNHHKHITQFNNLKDYLVDDMSSSFNIFYEMVDFLITRIFKVIVKFRQEISEIEKNLFRFDRDKDNLKEILIVKRNLINFLSIISPLQTTLEDLQKKYRLFIDSEGIEKIDDSLDKIKKIINNLDNFSSQMRLLTETNESLISRSTNDTVKVLTVISIMGILPTFLAGFFGMNLYFGWSQTSDSFYPLMVVSALIVFSSGFIYMYFKKRGWI